MPQPHSGVTEPEDLARSYESGLPDTRPERSFDRLTHLAQALFGCESARVSLLDGNNLWLKSQLGSDQQETPGESSFCDHTVREPRVLWVEDALTDPRFAGNPLVTGEARVRFYCGAPIRLESGHATGAICVLGAAPRVFDPALAERLCELADIAAEQIDRRTCELQEARARQRTHASERRLRSALDMGDLLAFETAADSVHFEGDPEILKVIGLSPDVYTADPLLLADPAGPSGSLSRWRLTATIGETFRHVYQVAAADTWISARVDIVAGEDGGPRVLGIIKDVSRFKRHEQIMDQAREAAESASRAKSEFLATVSHEIRTPLNGVLGMAQALQAEDLTASQREKLNVIRRSGEVLLALLNDVLDLSKIEAGKLQLEDVDFHLEHVARGAMATFMALAEEKGVSFVLDIEDGAKGVFRGDSTRVRQLLYNLVSNALKFTGKGEVRVSIRRLDEDLLVEVADSGIGIAADKLSSLFQKFVQADGSTTRRFGGTGLGLAICRELAELMGGDIQARSTEGLGSVFTLRLPLPRVADASFAPLATPAMKSTRATCPGLKVLAVDDNDVNRLVLKTLLAPAGIEPCIVENGARALAAWMAEEWDIILMDVQMPEMDGPTATRAIRAQEARLGRRRTPILALTANAMSHQAKAYESAGMDGVVAKPFQVSQLFKAIEQALDSQVSSGSRPAGIQLAAPTALAKP